MVVIGLTEGHLQKMARAVAESLGPEAASLVEYFRPDQFIAHLEALPVPPKPEVPEIRRGYKIKRSEPKLSAEEQKQREETAICGLRLAMSIDVDVKRLSAL